MTHQPRARKAALRLDVIRRAIEGTGRVGIAELMRRLGASELMAREDLMGRVSRGELPRGKECTVASQHDGVELSLKETSTTDRAQGKAIVNRFVSMIEDRCLGAGHVFFRERGKG